MNTASTWSHTKGMWFDSTYVSLLSERHLGTPEWLAWPRRSFVGLSSNLSAMLSDRPLRVLCISPERRQPNEGSFYAVLCVMGLSVVVYLYREGVRATVRIYERRNNCLIFNTLCNSLAPRLASTDTERSCCIYPALRSIVPLRPQSITLLHDHHNTCVTHHFGTPGTVHHHRIKVVFPPERSGSTG